MDYKVILVWGEIFMLISTASELIGIPFCPHPNQHFKVFVFLIIAILIGIG